MVKNYNLAFIEPEGLLPGLQKPTTVPYTASVQSSLHIYTLFIVRSILILSSHL
jgi:hypothetical protein